MSLESNFSSALAGFGDAYTKKAQRDSAQANTDARRMDNDIQLADTYLAEAMVKGLYITKEDGTLGINPDGGLEAYYNMDQETRESGLNVSSEFNNYLSKNGIKKGTWKTPQPKTGYVPSSELKKAREKGIPLTEEQIAAFKSQTTYIIPVEKKKGIFGFLTAGGSDAEDDTEVIALSGSELAGFLELRGQTLNAKKNPREARRQTVYAQNPGKVVGTGPDGESFDTLISAFGQMNDDKDLNGSDRAEALGGILDIWKGGLDDETKARFDNANKDLIETASTTDPKTAVNSGAPGSNLPGANQLAKEDRMFDAAAPVYLNDEAINNLGFFKKDGYRELKREHIDLTNRIGAAKELEADLLKQKTRAQAVLDNPNASAAEKTQAKNTLNSVTKRLEDPEGKTYTQMNARYLRNKKQGLWSLGSSPTTATAGSLDEAQSMLLDQMDDMATEGIAKQGNKKNKEDIKQRKIIETAKRTLKNQNLSVDDRARAQARLDKANAYFAVPEDKQGGPIPQFQNPNATAESQQNAIDTSDFPELGNIETVEQALELLNSGQLDSFLTEKTIASSRQKLEALKIKSMDQFVEKVNDGTIPDPYTHLLILESVIAGPNTTRGDIFAAADKRFNYSKTGDPDMGPADLVAGKIALANSQTARLNAQASYNNSLGTLNEKALTAFNTKTKNMIDDMTLGIKEFETYNARGKLMSPNKTVIANTEAKIYGYLDDLQEMLGKKDGDSLNTFLEGGDNTLKRQLKTFVGYQIDSQLRESGLFALPDLSDWASDWPAPNAPDAYGSLFDQIRWKVNAKGKPEKLVRVRRMANGEEVEAESSLNVSQVRGLFSPDTFEIMFRVLPRIEYTAPAPAP
tara:strand:- start:4589 stop:7165 length:2577 start_codon:yes stop_codon:yes gene_type:complete